jgi:hypothetical protein
LGKYGFLWDFLEGTCNYTDILLLPIKHPLFVFETFQPLLIKEYRRFFVPYRRFSA